MAQDIYATEIESWRARRLADLLADDGWLNLTDRVELEPGRYSIGSAPGLDIVLSVGPARLGELTLDASGTRLTPEGGAPLAFAPVPDAPPRLLHAGLLLEMTLLEGVHALRVRDTDPVSRNGFAGLRHFPLDPAWRLRAEWREMAAPSSLAIGMVNGVTTSVTLTHRAVFHHEGAEVELLPTHVKAGKPMFVFRDLTARDATYAASRFLYGEEIGGGGITLDFNKAFNPPCAFTDFAICPLPPRENILPFRIEAGELRP